MSLSKNYQEKIVPQRLTLTGSADDEFVIRKKDGTAVMVITGDGKIAWNGSTPAAKGAALTTALPNITITDPVGTADNAIAAVTSTTPFGFSNAAELITILYKVQNLVTRVGEIEARLQAAGIIS